MRVAVVQFDPKIGKIQANIKTADRLCSQIAPKSVDLVCLPEMCFTGYVFTDSAHIAPYLEDSLTGPTSEYCRQLAQRLSCYVVAGYAERLATHETSTVTIKVEENDDGEIIGVKTVEKEIKQVGANSAVVFDPDGIRISDYRKTNLFVTDKTWAKPGTGFKTLHLPPPLNTVTLGICMDLNVQPPATWTTADGPYEIADHCIQTETGVLILLNAWLFSGDEGEDGEGELGKGARDWGTLNFWATRLRPLWAKDPSIPPGGDGKKDTTVIICNRCGDENGKTFAGTSSLFSLKWNSGKPILLHALSRRSEGVGIWDA